MQSAAAHHSRRLSKKPKANPKVAVSSLSSVELSTKVMDLIPRTMAELRQRFRSRRKTTSLSNLSVPQVRVLFQLRRNANTNSGLAEKMGVGVPAMSRLVNGLKDKGLITRKVAPEDRREFHLHLTASGRRLVENLRHENIQELAGKISQMSELEKQKLNEACLSLAQLFGI